MLEKKDLKDIKGIVKDVVDDSIDNFAVIVKGEFKRTDEKIGGNSKKINKLLATQLVMKDEMATKDDLLSAKNEILSAVDGIKGKNEKFEAESAANLGAHGRMQDDINEVRGHVGLKVKNPAITPKIA